MQAAQPAPTTWRLLPAAPSPKKEGGNWFDNATSFVSAIVEEGSKTVVDSAEALWNTSPREIHGAPTESSSPVRRSILLSKSNDSASPSDSPRTRAHTTNHSASAAFSRTTSADSLEAKIMAARASSARAALFGSHESSSFVKRTTPSSASGRSTPEENQRVRPSSVSSASGCSTPEDNQRVRFSPTTSISFSCNSSPSSLRSSRLQDSIPRPTLPLAAAASRRPPPSISSRSLAPLPFSPSW
mmetsp:Transcript_19817/g.45896  ORF Transcript_19817/g.45896 Transcript_19817/m.45896 type:complete len:243 (+) Transcript_19817:80-808(+)